MRREFMNVLIDVANHLLRKDNGRVMNDIMLKNGTAIFASLSVPGRTNYSSIRGKSITYAVP